MTARKADASYKIPKMEFEGEEDSHCGKTSEILGNELKKYIIGLNNSLYRQAPNKIESELIHQLFKKQKYHTHKRYTTVSDTVIEYNALMHSQEKILTGRYLEDTL